MKVKSATGIRSISIAFFLLSFTQQAYCTTSLCRSAIDAIVMGAFGMFFGGAAAVWIANPLILASWIGINKFSKLSLITSALATAIALMFLRFGVIVDNEGGHLNKIISYGLGYWLWAASAGVMLTGNVILFFRKRAEKLST